MGEMRQSPALRAQLDAKWQADPAVIAMREAVTAFAAAEDLQWNAEGLTAVLRFGRAHLAAHGPLPDSGILIG